MPHDLRSDLPILLEELNLPTALLNHPLVYARIIFNDVSILPVDHMLRLEHASVKLFSDTARDGLIELFDVLNHLVYVIADFRLGWLPLQQIINCAVVHVRHL